MRVSRRDRLSLNPLLVLICEYLDPISLNRCITVNQTFHQTITRNWRRMQRLTAQVSIKQSKGEHGNVPVMSLYCSMGINNEIAIEIYPTKLKIEEGSVRSCWFLVALHQHLGRRKSSIPCVCSFPDLFTLVCLNLNHLQLLSAVLDSCFSRIEIVNFELEDKHYFPDVVLMFLREGIIKNKPLRRTVPNTVAKTIMCNYLHSDILRALDFDNAILCDYWSQDPLDTKSMKSIPTDIRTKLTIKSRAQLPQLVECLMEEWLGGTRQINHLCFEECNRMDVLLGIDRAFDEFPYAKRTNTSSNDSECEIFERDTEPRLLLFTSKDKYLIFESYQ